MRPATGRIHHHIFQISLLHAREKSLEMTFAAPIGIALVHHAPCAQLLDQVTLSGVRAVYPEQGIEKYSVHLFGAVFAKWLQRLNTLPLRIGEGTAFWGHSGQIS